MPYNLPEGFEWCDTDIDDEKTVYLLQKQYLTCLYIDTRSLHSFK